MKWCNLIRKIMIYLSAVFPFYCISYAQTGQTAPDEPRPLSDSIDQDEYDVLSDLITNEFVISKGPKSEIEAFTGTDKVKKNKLKVIITDQTDVSEVDDPSNPLTYGNLVDSSRGEDGILNRETFDDFVAKNQKSVKLEEKFKFDFQYKLLAKNKDRDWSWEKFYKQYPKYIGITQVSRVGFNGDQTQALVYIGRRQHWQSGTGSIYLLMKKDGRWIVKNIFNRWIS